MPEKRNLQTQISVHFDSSKYEYELKLMCNLVRLCHLKYCMQAIINQHKPTSTTTDLHGLQTLLENIRWD